MPQRTVRFYRIVDQNRQAFPNLFPFDDLRNAVRDLNDIEAYIRVGRMELLGSSYDSPIGAGRRPQVALLALDRITRDVHLRIERRRNYRPLQLAADETLAEPTFYSVFDQNVLGVMRNSGTAPGPASFRDYINAGSFFTDPIDVVPLSDANSLRALGEVGTLTKFDFAVGPDVTADVFEQAPLVARVLRHFREQLGNVAVEVVVKISPVGQSSASDSALQQVQNVVTSDAVGFVDRAKITYRRLEDGKADTYDFINEAVAMPIEVDVESSTNQPTERSASEALAAAYNDLYPDIVSALNSLS